MNVPETKQKPMDTSTPSKLINWSPGSLLYRWYDQFNLGGSAYFDSSLQSKQHWWTTWSMLKCSFSSAIYKNTALTAESNQASAYQWTFWATWCLCQPNDNRSAVGLSGSFQAFVAIHTWKKECFSIYCQHFPRSVFLQAHATRSNTGRLVRQHVGVYS